MMMCFNMDLNFFKSFVLFHPQAQISSEFVSGCEGFSLSVSSAAPVWLLPAANFHLKTAKPTPTNKMKESTLNTMIQVMLSFSGGVGGVGGTNGFVPVGRLSLPT